MPRRRARRRGRSSPSHWEWVKRGRGERESVGVCFTWSRVVLSAGSRDPLHGLWELVSPKAQRKLSPVPAGSSGCLGQLSVAFSDAPGCLIGLWQRSAVATVGGPPWRADRPLLAHSTAATLPVRLHSWCSSAEVEEADRLLFGGPPIEKVGRGLLACAKTFSVSDKGLIGLLQAFFCEGGLFWGWARLWPNQPLSMSLNAVTE